MSASKPQNDVVALANYTFEMSAQLNNGLSKPSKNEGKNFEIVFGINTQKKKKEKEIAKKRIKPQ